jgi:hypothetical protein
MEIKDDHDEGLNKLLGRLIFEKSGTAMIIINNHGERQGSNTLLFAGLCLPQSTSIS